jgi:hypothetical protein
MRMYFHASLADYVLFYEWVPRTTLQYAFTCVAIVAMAQVSALLKIGRRRAVERLQQHQRRARAHRSVRRQARPPSAVAAADDTVPMIAPRRECQGGAQGGAHHNADAAAAGGVCVCQLWRSTMR